MKNNDVIIHIGVLLAHSPRAKEENMRQFIDRLTAKVASQLNNATNICCEFHHEISIQLKDDTARYASDFLDRTNLRMVHGPYDVMIVVTDAPIISSRHKTVPALSSQVSRIIVFSTQSLLHSPRGMDVRTLTEDSVVLNGAVLLLHQFGHLFELKPNAATGSLMSDYKFNKKLETVPEFTEKEQLKIQQQAKRFPDQILFEGGIIQEFIFHLKSAFKHPKGVLIPLWRNRAPLIPLSLSRLSTAAVAPALILVFSAESWDVAYHMTNRVTWIAAIAAVVISAVYLMFSLNLNFPRVNSTNLTEHGAVINVSMFLTLLFAMAGLFGLIFITMLLIEYFVFPPDLMRQWPSLDNPTFNIFDKFRLAAFISMLGVLTGALAGGLESRNVIREFALFREKV